MWQVTAEGIIKIIKKKLINNDHEKYTYIFHFFLQLDYCASLKHLESVQDKPNYKFIQVCTGFNIQFLLE